MHGLKIGEVTDVRLMYDEAKKAIVAPVYFEVQPERIVGVGNRVYDTDEKAVEALLERGLRASLQSTSLITGQQSVALAFAADAPSASLQREGDDFVIPITEGGGFAELSSSATELVDKVRTIPFDAIGQNLSGILKSVNDATKGPEMKSALASLQTTLASAQDMVKQLDKNMGPASKRLPEISADLAEDVDECQQADRFARQRLRQRHQAQSGHEPVDGRVHRRRAGDPRARRHAAAKSRGPDQGTGRRSAGMTRLRHCRLAVFGLLAIALAACSSSPPALYTIAPVQGPAQTGAPPVVVLQTIGLARYLDRSQIVRSSEANRLDVQNNDWWGEPLGAMLSRVLTEELTQRLPQSTVINEAGAVTAIARRGDRDRYSPA